MHEADRPVVMNDEYGADELDLFLLGQLRVLGPSADTNGAGSGQFYFCPIDFFVARIGWWIESGQAQSNDCKLALTGEDMIQLSLLE